MRRMQKGKVPLCCSSPEAAFRAHSLWAGSSDEEWESAGEFAPKISIYNAPRDKLVCILNCCELINNVLLNESISSNEDHLGADELIK